MESEAGSSESTSVSGMRGAEPTWESDAEPSGATAEPSPEDDTTMPNGKVDDDEATQTEVGDLLISGRILNQAGDPITGIAVSARRYARGGANADG